MIKVELKTVTITGVNIKDTCTITIKVDSFKPDDLTELCKLINSEVALTLSDNQSTLETAE